MRFHWLKQLIVATAVASWACAFAEELELGDTKALHQGERYRWTISSELAAKEPSWGFGEAIPLSVDDAIERAYEWVRKQPIGGPLPSRPTSINILPLPGTVTDRYFYKISYLGNGSKDSFWTVHVLMSGVVVEPRKVLPVNKPK